MAGLANDVIQRNDTTNDSIFYMSDGIMNEQSIYGWHAGSFSRMQESVVRIFFTISCKELSQLP